MSSELTETSVDSDLMDNEINVVQTEYPKNLKRLRKCRITPQYLRYTDRPIQRDIYRIFNIDTNTAFEEGFNIEKHNRLYRSKAIKLCEMNEKSCNAIISTNVTVREYIHLIWNLIARPEYECIYRKFGIEGFSDLGINIDPKVLRGIAKRMKRHYKKEQQ